MDKKIHVYDFRTREIEYTIPTMEELTCLTVSRDCQHMLVNVGKEIQLIDMDTADVVRRFCGQKQTKYVVRSSFGGAGENFVVSGSEGAACPVFRPRPRARRLFPSFCLASMCAGHQPSAGVAKTDGGSRFLHSHLAPGKRNAGGEIGSSSRRMRERHCLEPSESDHVCLVWGRHPGAYVRSTLLRSSSVDLHSRPQSLTRHHLKKIAGQLPRSRHSEDTAVAPTAINLSTVHPGLHPGEYPFLSPTFVSFLPKYSISIRSRQVGSASGKLCASGASSLSSFLFLLLHCAFFGRRDSCPSLHLPHLSFLHIARPPRVVLHIAPPPPGGRPRRGLVLQISQR